MYVYFACSELKTNTCQSEQATAHADELQQLARKITQDSLLTQSSAQPSPLMPYKTATLTHSSSPQSSPVISKKTKTYSSLPIQTGTPTTQLTLDKTQLSQSPQLPPTITDFTDDPRPKCCALFPHQGLSPNELSFQSGDVLYILRKDPGGWWEAELNGAIGWIPHNYVQEF